MTSRYGRFWEFVDSGTGRVVSWTVVAVAATGAAVLGQLGDVAVGRIPESASTPQVLANGWFWASVGSVLVAAGTVGLQGYALTQVRRRAGLALKSAASPDGITGWGSPSVVPDHLAAAGRGVSHVGQDGQYFRGRRVALREINAWLADTDAARVLVVTGGAGMGKSAILGRVALTSDPRRRSELPTDDDGEKVPVGSVSLVINAAGMGPRDVAASIARAGAAGAVLESEHQLVGVLARYRDEHPGPPFTVLVDGVDESTDPVQLVTDVLKPVGSMEVRYQVRLLVGARPEHDGHRLVDPLTGARVIDLGTVDGGGDVRYFDEQDLYWYVLARLRLARDGNPYLSVSPEVEAVARRIAADASPSFLIAGLTAREHGEHDSVPADPDDLTFPQDVEAALTRYLHPIDDLNPELTARKVLIPLAYAEAPGLPIGLWRVALEALSGIDVSEARLESYAREKVGDYLVQTTEHAGEPVYRIFHQALNDTLTERTPQSRVRDHRRITVAFLAWGRRHGWQDAPDYLRRSLVTHATAGRAISDVVTILDATDYILHADLPRLHSMLTRENSNGAHRYRDLIATTPTATDLDPAGRAAAFSVTEALTGTPQDQNRFTRLARDHHASIAAAWWASPHSARKAGNATPFPGVVRGLAAMPDGHIVSGSSNGSVQIWDLDTGTRQTLTGHTSTVRSVAVMPDGRIVSGSNDLTIRIWDPRTGSHQVLVGHTDLVTAVAVLPDGRIISGSNDLTVRVWDPDTSNQQVLTGHTDWVLAVAVLPDGRIASGGNDHSVRIWDLSTGTNQILTGSTRNVWTLSVMPDGRLISGGGDGNLRIWDLANGIHQAKQVVTGFSSANAMALMPDGRLAIGDDMSTTSIWDPATNLAQALSGFTGSVWAVAAMPDNRIVSSSGDGTVRIWDPSTDSHQILTDDASPVLEVVVTPDGRIVSGSQDHTVQIWDPSADARRTLTGHTGWVRTVAVMPDGRIASGSYDHTVRVWDPSTGHHQTLHGHTDWVWAVTVMPDGRIVSGSFDRTVRIWDLTTGDHQILTGHKHPVRAVAVLPDGRIVSGSNDLTIRIWDLSTGTHEVLTGHTDLIRVLAVLPDGRIISGSNDRTVRVWDQVNGTNEIVTRHADWLRAVATTADGRVVSGSYDGDVHVSDPTSRTAMVRIQVLTSMNNLTVHKDHVILALYDGILALELLDAQDDG